MRLRHFTRLCALLWVAAYASVALAAELVTEDFTGAAASPLSGRTPAVNLLSPGTAWVADSIIAANGQVNDGTNTDRGAYLDLGSGFSFKPNQTYTLSFTWSNLSNGILFAGFSTTAPTVGSQVQTQGTNFGVRARLITSGTDTIAAWKNPGAAATTGTSVTTTAGSATLTLTTRSLSDASFTVTGLSSPIAVDLSSAYRYLWLAYEDPTTATPASDAKFNSLSFTGPAPLVPPTVTVSPDSEILRGSQTVSLTSSSASAVIHYTLDGSLPGASSPTYAMPLVLIQSATMQALAIESGNLSGPVVRRDFVVLPAGIPNVLIIVGDDVGYGDLQCYGAVNTATPNLDSLAFDGIRFSQFTTAGPGDAASQFALLTGRVAARGGFGAEVSPGQTGIRAEEWTLGEMLRKKGYRTGFIGQWNLGSNAGSHPNDQGFGLFHGLPYRLTSNPPLEENRQVLSASPDASTLLGELTTRARSFIAEASSEPFALVFQPPALPASGSSVGGPQGNRVEALDASVGGLLAELDSRNLRNNTLVVFLTDGGAPRALNGGSNSLLRDGAGTNWEGGVRSPLIVRWPAAAPAGQFNQSILRLTDLFPSLAGIASGYSPADRPSDGASRATSLLGVRTRPIGDEVVFTYRHDGNRYKPASVRLGKWKQHLSIVNSDSENTKPTTGTQLYDLRADPSEYINRASEQASLVSQLQALASQQDASLPAAGSTDLPAPKTPLLAPAKTGMIGQGSSSSVSFDFDRPKDSLNDQFGIEHSQNLQAWSRLPIQDFIQSALDLPNGVERISLKVPLDHPAFNGPRHFVRLIASRPTSP